MSINRFMDAYADELGRAVRERPQDYLYDQAEVPAVVGRMRSAIVAGSYNKDSAAFKAACKRLGIKHTYTAIGAFIHAGGQPLE